MCVEHRNLRMHLVSSRGIRLLVATAGGPLSKLVDEADSKSAAADPASRFESGEGHHPKGRTGEVVFRWKRPVLVKDRLQQVGAAEVPR